MSKGNMLLGHARGKVGSLVFSRANGKQIVRSRAEVVKNPQTESQMIQRIFLNTVAQAYSKMSVITDHSFEGIQQGQKTMSAFMSRNLKSLRTKVAELVQDGVMFSEIYEFSPINSNVLAINDYIIAAGSLPEVNVSSVGEDAMMGFVAPGNTYGDIISHYGLQRGDQLTFIALVKSETGNRGFAYARVILDPQDENMNDLPLTTPFIADGAIVSPNVRNEGTFEALSFADGTIKFGLTTGWMMGAAIIVSRKRIDGQWLRSNATLKQNADSTDVVYDLQTCLDMLKTGGVDGINSIYLNNAGTGVVANSQAANAQITGLVFNGQTIARGANVQGNLPASENPITAVFTCKNANGLKVAVVDAQGAVSESLEATVVNGTATVSGASFDYNVPGGHFVLMNGNTIVDQYATIVEQ